MRSGNSTGAIMQELQTQQTGKEQLDLLSINQEIIQQRENEIRQIETNTLTANTMLRDINNVLKLQSEVVTSIHGNFDTAAKEIASGMKELDKKEKNLERFGICTIV